MSEIILGHQLREAYLEVDRRGLAEIEHETERRLAEVAPVRAAEHELIEATAAVHGISGS